MATSGNQKRTREKNKCRRALADHINERLGLQVHPDKVRLRPRPEDQYRWFVAEPMRKYFQSNLSGGSLGGFQKICEALQHGNLIEAVPVNNSRQDDSKSEDKYYSTAPDQSFTTTIQRLEQNNRQARLEYEKSQEKAQKERLDAEQRELQWKTVAEQYEVRLKEMREKIIPALHTLTLHLSQYFDLEDLESQSANGSGIVDHVEP